MKKQTHLLLLLFSLSIFSCKETTGEFEPDIQGNVPSNVAGKWTHGYFSMSNFWGYDGSYQGNPLEQAELFDFKSNGEYELYYIGTANDYGCRTEALSYFKGKVKFDEENKTFTVTPKEARFRGFYSCAPSRNFDRKAEKSELLSKTYHYTFETDTNGKTWFVIVFSDNSKSYFDSITW